VAENFTGQMHTLSSNCVQVLKETQKEKTSTCNEYIILNIAIVCLLRLKENSIIIQNTALVAIVDLVRVRVYLDTLTLLVMFVHLACKMPL